ncbi:MAG: TlpA family protein disulfide reductase [Propionibacteriaceae bacterium]|jgi:peroxiredoxin|nr:TlpA family protein disulfide reductase [Propionibacteriaceae bacterium]
MSRTNLRNVVVIILTTVVILGGLWLVKGPWRDGGTDPAAVSSVAVSVAPGQAAPAVGQVAADFTAVTTAGETISLSQLRGQPVWLVFGATWCANCRAEAPDVAAVAAAMDSRAHVVTIYVGETNSTVQDYVARLKLTGPHVADSAKAIASTYAVLGVPAHYFIDGEGVIQRIVMGTLTAPVATQSLESLM